MGRPEGQGRLHSEFKACLGYPTSFLHKIYGIYIVYVLPCLILIRILRRVIYCFCFIDEGNQVCKSYTTSSCGLTLMWPSHKPIFSPSPYTMLFSSRFPFSASGDLPAVRLFSPLDFWSSFTGTPVLNHRTQEMTSMTTSPALQRMALGWCPDRSTAEQSGLTRVLGLTEPHGKSPEYTESFSLARLAICFTRFSPNYSSKIFLKQENLQRENIP